MVAHEAVTEAVEALRAIGLEESANFLEKPGFANPRLFELALDRTAAALRVMQTIAPANAEVVARAHLAVTRAFRSLGGQS